MEQVTDTKSPELAGSSPKVNGKICGITKLQNNSLIQA